MNTALSVAERTHSHGELGHSHDHDHSHDHEPVSWHALGAVPVLDIGREVGAVLAYLSAVPACGEIEMQPIGDPSGRFHTGVHRRVRAGEEVDVALFPEVIEGRYELLDENGAPLAVLDVRGGDVTEVHV